MKEIFDPTIGFSGFMGAVIIAFITGGGLKSNPFRLVISQEELKFMSSWAKMVRYIYLAVLIGIISSLYIIFLTSIDKEYKYAWAYKFVLNVVTPETFIFIAIFLLGIVILLNSKWIQNKITSMSSKNNKINLGKFILLLY